MTVRTANTRFTFTFTVIMAISLVIMITEHITVKNMFAKKYYQIHSDELLREKKFQKIQKITVNDSALSDNLVDAMIGVLRERSVIWEKFWTLDYKETREIFRFNLTGAKYLDKTGDIRLKEKEIPSWSKFMLNINDHYMYDWDDTNVDRLLKDMATLHPADVEQNTEGSELKFNFIFHDKFWANGKAMRYSRETQTNPNHFVIDEFERHIAEIGGFHLDRLLGFCRVPPTTGRRVNLTEFRQLVPEEMRDNFFISPVGNTCFYGECEEHCNPKYAFCGKGDMIEFSLMVYIPYELDGHEVYYYTYNYYRHAPERKLKSDWTIDADFCDYVRTEDPYHQLATLLNLVDTHIFDFLIVVRHSCPNIWFFAIDCFFCMEYLLTSAFGLTTVVDEFDMNVCTSNTRFTFAFTVIIISSLAIMTTEHIMVKHMYAKEYYPIHSDETLRDKKFQTYHQNITVNASALSDNLVDAMIEVLQERSVIWEKFWTLDYKETREIFRFNLTGAKYLDKTGDIRLKEKEIPSWSKFMLNINDHYMYDWDDTNVDRLLKDMATLHPANVEQNIEGSELKFNFIFHKKFWANGKAMRFSREIQTNPNHFVVDEFERHIAEIGAFHLDRLLGFCRVPPTTGRRVNLTEFRQLVPEEMRGHFFKSPVGNTCFYGKCEEYCKPRYAFCGKGDIIEFSLMVYIPYKLDGQEVYYDIYNYYRQAPEHKIKAPWAIDANYCDYVRTKDPYHQKAALLNLVDTHIFDFLIGNRDRYSIAVFNKFGTASNPILYDNGRGFGTSDKDYKSILTPVRQCCQIKKSTLLKLIKLYKGPERLSSLMDASLASDPVAPVLIPPHLNALDRRLVIVLKTVAECIVTDKRPLKSVVVDDLDDVYNTRSSSGTKLKSGESRAG